MRATPEPQPGETLDQQCVRRLLTQQGDAAFEQLAEVQQTLLHVQRYLESPSANDRTLAPPPTETPSEEIRAAVSSAEQMELQRRFARLKAMYDSFRLDLLGGPVWSWLGDLANPGSQRLEAWMRTVERYLSSWLPSFAGQATALLGRIAFNLAIVALALFYFLKDGQAMVRSLMWLSPLDDRYEELLLAEFVGVSRAVVLATLLSALVQGLLAGPAYYLAGFQSVFMLVLLTTLLSPGSVRRCGGRLVSRLPVAGRRRVPLRRRTGPVRLRRSSSSLCPITWSSRTCWQDDRSCIPCWDC